MATIITETLGHENQHDRTLRALIEAKNWKQALVHVEKRLKKTKSDRLLVNKALIQLRLNDGKTKEQALASLEAALQSTVMAKDNDVVYAIEDAATAQPNNVRLQVMVSSMWEKTLKARPNDEGLLSELFERKLLSFDWDAARKLAMTRMKTQRDWYFRYLICLHLSAYSKRSKIPENMKAMNAGLAVKSLLKAAKDVVPDLAYLEDSSNDNETPGEVRKKYQLPNSKAIQSQRELDLVIEVLLQHEKTQEVLEILDDDTRTGIRSRIGNGFATLKDKINVLSACKEWQKLWQLCDDLLRSLVTRPLSRARNTLEKLADDWDIWEAYLEASVHLFETAPKRLGSALELMQSAANNANSQNAFLMLVDHGLRYRHVYEKLGQDIVANCTAYFVMYHRKPFVFRQLRRTFLLKNSEQENFLGAVRKTSQEATDNLSDSKYNRRAWIFAEINSLKLDYYLLVSRKGTMGTHEALLESFAASCLRLYKITFLWNVDCKTEDHDPNAEAEGPTDRGVGDDAAILAAMAMLQLYFSGKDECLIFAAFILESLLSHSKHNYEAVLLLIRVQIHMGQIGRATQLFGSLDVKHIQSLSTLWILISRISTLHPHVSKRIQCDPLAILDDAFHWTTNVHGHIKRACVDCLAEKSYRNLLKTFRTFESTSTSISQIIITSETLKLRWAASAQHPVVADSSVFDNNEYLDTREIGAFPELGHPSQPTLEELLRPGPLPKEMWCQSQQRLLAIRHLWQGSSLQAEDANSVLQLDLSYRDKAKEQSKHDIDMTDMTRGEVLEDQIYTAALRICTVACTVKDQGKSNSSKSNYSHTLETLKKMCNYATSEKAIDDLLPRIQDTSRIPHANFSWLPLHNIYQWIYILKLLLGTVRFLAITEQEWKNVWGQDTNEFLKEEQKLESAALKVIHRIKEWSQAQQSELAKDIWESSITNILDGKSMVQKLIRSSHGVEPVFLSHEKFSSNIIMGWVDSLDGFTDINSLRL